MEEVRNKVKDVEDRCKVIHASAVRNGIRLNSVAITEERRVAVCSHAEHQPSVTSRWRVVMEPCGGIPHDTATKIRMAPQSSMTLDGVTALVISMFDDMPAVAPAEKACCACAENPSEQDIADATKQIAEATPDEDAKPLDSVILDAPDEDEDAKP